MRTLLLAIAVGLLLSVTGRCRADYDDAGGVATIKSKPRQADWKPFSSLPKKNLPTERLQLLLLTGQVLPGDLVIAVTEELHAGFVVPAGVLVPAVVLWPAPKDPQRIIKNPSNIPRPRR